VPMELASARWKAGSPATWATLRRDGPPACMSLGLLYISGLANRHRWLGARPGAQPYPTSGGAGCRIPQRVQHERFPPSGQVAAGFPQGRRPRGGTPGRRAGAGVPPAPGGPARRPPAARHPRARPAQAPAPRPGAAAAAGGPPLPSRVGFRGVLAWRRTLVRSGTAPPGPPVPRPCG